MADFALPATKGLGLISTRTQIVAMSCACAGVTALLYAVDPTRHAIFPQCLLYQRTGIYCAGCGATRAMHALLHGRVLEALHDNVLVVAGLPVALVVAGSFLFKAWKENAWSRVVLDERALLRWGIPVLLLAIGFMVLRNLPGWPFDWLKPLAG